jgi:hypothetical protein
MSPLTNNGSLARPFSTDHTKQMSDTLSLRHSRYHYVDQQRDFEPGSLETFDRMAFAARALGLLRPPLSVALYPRASKLQVERASTTVAKLGKPWAVVGIPVNASRRHIAYALAELSGVEDLPYVVDMLVQHAGQCD